MLFRSVLVDIEEGLAQDKALDMAQAGAVLGYDRSIVGTSDYTLTEGSGVVVMTAGLARKPGMSRDDLVAKNRDIVSEVCTQVARHASGAVLIMVTNPLDAMCHVALKTTGFPRRRVIGMAGILDAARFATFIGMELNVSRRDVRAMVLGGHGDTMVPLPRHTTVRGVPLTELADTETIERLVERTRKGGGEIVGLLKSGSAFYAPGASAFEMVEAVLTDARRLVPCCVYTQGEYGLNDIPVGLPSILSRNGLEKIVELDLAADEREALHASAEAVKSVIDGLG